MGTLNKGYQQNTSCWPVNSQRNLSLPWVIFLQHLNELTHLQKKGCVSVSLIDAICVSISDISYDTLQVVVLLKQVNAFQILILIICIDISYYLSAFAFFVIFFVHNCDSSRWMYADKEGRFMIFLCRLGLIKNTFQVWNQQHILQAFAHHLFKLVYAVFMGNLCIHNSRNHGNAPQNVSK